MAARHEELRWKGGKVERWKGAPETGRFSDRLYKVAALAIAPLGIAAQTGNTPRPAPNCVIPGSRGPSGVAYPGSSLLGTPAARVGWQNLFATEAGGLSHTTSAGRTSAAQTADGGQ